MDSGRKRLLSANIARWVGRALSVPAIIFAGAHIIDPDPNPEVTVYWYEWLAVGLMFASVLALLVGWWKEKIGGWAALVLMVLFVTVYGIYAKEFFPAWHIILAGIGLPAALFLVSDYLRK
jgi:hypothetical protein